MFEVIYMSSNPEINEALGNKLRIIRKDQKITREALAEKLNVSRQTVSKWETNEALSEMEKDLELCRIFNCSLDNLFRKC